MKRFIVCSAGAALLTACTANYPVAPDMAKQLTAARQACMDLKKAQQLKSYVGVSDCARARAEAILKNDPTQTRYAAQWRKYWDADRTTAGYLDNNRVSEDMAKHLDYENLVELENAVTQQDLGPAASDMGQSRPIAPNRLGCTSTVPYSKTVYSGCN